ncbi:FAD-dependent oxidoreductase [Rhizobium sp. DKSPLA3]|uniref:FAD-dependent oxidoreductase n=1 Tax=Rhizobium quercicola TaxID=2901226 RepID=A0A9X1T9E9_9HYPH|nr:FAD-dependent oxidoreductase [Rhizobium quercicola]MCD7111808.1 FAD-dependent oxidoreductase [Rhizobium quercicola]
MNKEIGMDDVLIVGAGPTGMVLALWLTKQGVRVRMIDRNTGPGTTSRAMAVQARTLELYRQLDMADAVIAAGMETASMNMWARGQRRAHVSLGEAGEDVTQYPFVLTYPQDRHERLLVQRLAALGVEIERETELRDFTDHGDHVEARVTKDGTEHVYKATYLAGCDGARSPVRHALGNQFEGGTYKQVFYVADAEVSGLDTANEMNVCLDVSDFVMVMPYDNGQCRLIGVIQDERAERAESLTFEDVGHKAIDSMGLKVDKVNWFSTYRVHHRVTDRFRHGRVFLLGDAAHVHSPAGGQGMNTGIQDAINLAWKIAAVVKGQASDSLLDSYDLERRPFARKLVDTTDRLFTFATVQGGFADFVRTRIAPTLIGTAYRIDSVREMMFRLISQTTLSYDDSPLSQGKAGSIEGGDRLPWVRIDGVDNHAPLSDIGWQVHVYGAAAPALTGWCQEHGVPLHVFDWTPDHKKAGLAKDGLYLVRPDTWVGLALSDQSTAALDAYLGNRSLSLENRA